MPVPGCSHRVFLEGRHATHWIDGGEASPGNVVSLCTRHPVLVHEHGWRVELDDRQAPRFFDPRGRLVAAVPSRPRPRDLGWSRIERDNAQLEIDAASNAPRWDGLPVQYGAVIDALVAADGLR